MQKYIVSSQAISLSAITAKHTDDMKTILNSCIRKFDMTHEGNINKFSISYNYILSFRYPIVDLSSCSKSPHAFVYIDGNDIDAEALVVSMQIRIGMIFDQKIFKLRT